jgi:hypothetical protein
MKVTHLSWSLPLVILEDDLFATAAMKLDNG